MADLPMHGVAMAAGDSLSRTVIGRTMDGLLEPDHHRGPNTLNPADPAMPEHDPDDPPPRRPDEPDPADCCGEGCVNCVYDVYEAALERYEAALAAWRARHR